MIVVTAYLAGLGINVFAVMCQAVFLNKAPPAEMQYIKYIGVQFSWQALWQLS